MKTLLLSFILALLLFSSRAQENIYGVFDTREDYQSGHLSVTITGKSPSDKIKPHLSFCDKYLVAIVNGTKSRFDKDSIFGFRDAKQYDHRFFNREDYVIVENKTITLYTAKRRVYSTSGKTFVLKATYFFSNGLSGTILPLTLHNLKNAFSDNMKFHDLLELEFEDGACLSSFDSVHKMFKVNYLLNKSIQ